MRYNDSELCAALRYEAQQKRRDPDLAHIADVFEAAADRIEVLSMMEHSLK